MSARKALRVRISQIELADALSLNFQNYLGLLKKRNINKKYLKSSVLAGHEARDVLKEIGFSYPRRVYSFQMLKGGVAKTTSAFFMGIRLAQYGAKVLFVDLDQQANLSSALGFEDESHPVWVDLIEGKTDLEKMKITLDENIDLIPSNLNNSVLDRVLMRTQRNWSMCVKGPLSKIKNKYDFILIDLAPALSVINTAATVASDCVVLPVNPDKFSMVGLGKHLDELKITKEEFGLNFENKVLFTKFDGREKLSQYYLEECLKKYEPLMFETYIRTSTEIKNALELKKDIFNSKMGIRDDFDGLAKEILGFELFNAMKGKKANAESPRI